MIEVLNLLAFSFSFLFGFEAPIVVEKSTFKIDQKEKTITILYENFNTLKEYKKQAINYIDSINNSVKLSTKIEGLTLISKTKIENSSNKNLIVKLKYSDISAISKNFKLNLSDSTIFVHPCETVKVNKGKILSNKNDNYTPQKISPTEVMDIYFKLTPCEVLKDITPL